MKWFSTYCLFLVLLFGTVAHALGRGCMEKHLRDAIELNEFRKERYAAASGGKSVQVSDALIDFEKELLFWSVWADLVAVPFQSKGIPILCEDLKDMALAPELPDSLPLAHFPLAQDFMHLDVNSIQSDLVSSLDNGFESVERVALSHLSSLSKERRLNCLVRHFLESIVVFSRGFSKHHSSLRSSLALRSYRLFLKQVIKSHIGYLATAHAIDELAVEVQSRGIPILCQDVPHLL